VPITQLWEEKVGLREPKDLSGVEAVQRGIAEEPLIRADFIRNHPEFDVEHHAFDILRLASHPFISATLDGELLYKGGNGYLDRCGIKPGAHGVLEIKTGSYSTEYYLRQWQGDALPNHYFAQVVQQLLVTGWDFAIVQAKLFRQDRTYSRGGNNFYLPETFEAQFTVFADHPDVFESKQTVLEADIYFWGCVQNKKSPDVAM
jgi:predicted phage-related endonuclease